jgi:hypothetical protein
MPRLNYCDILQQCEVNDEQQLNDDQPVHCNQILSLTVAPDGLHEISDQLMNNDIKSLGSLDWPPDDLHLTLVKLQTKFVKSVTSPVLCQ